MISRIKRWAGRTPRDVMLYVLFTAAVIVLIAFVIVWLWLTYGYASSDRQPIPPGMIYLDV